MILSNEELDEGFASVDTSGNTIHLVMLDGLRRRHGEALLQACQGGGWEILIGSGDPCVALGEYYDHQFEGDSIPEVFDKVICAGLLD